ALGGAVSQVGVLYPDRVGLLASLGVPLDRVGDLYRVSRHFLDQGRAEVGGVLRQQRGLDVLVQRELDQLTAHIGARQHGGNDEESTQPREGEPDDTTHRSSWIRLATITAAGIGHSQTQDHPNRDPRAIPYKVT